MKNRYLFHPILVLFLFLSFMLSAVNNAVPYAEDGQLDLRAYNLEEDGVVKLDGQWCFYNNRFLSLDEAKEFDDYCLVEVPNNLNGQLCDGETLANRGYGTYYLRIIINEAYKNKLMMFNTNRVLAAAKIYVNNQLVCYNACPDSSKSASSASLVVHSSEVYLGSDTLDVLIHMSNYHAQKQGLFYSIDFGLAREMHKSILLSVGENLFFIGGMITMSLYFFMLYFFRKKDEVFLWFALMILAFSIYSLCLSGLYFSFMPDMGYELNYKVHIFCLFITMLMFIQYLHHLFPVEFGKTIYRILLIITSVFVVVALTFKVAINLDPFVCFGYFGILVLFYLFWIVFQTKRLKRDGANVLIGAFVILILTSVHDIMNELRIINSVYLMSFGIFLFLLLQTYYLSGRCSIHCFNSERLSLKLQGLNTDLKNRAKAQTITINLQTKEIEQQYKLCEEKEASLKSENEILELHLEHSKDCLTQKLSELVQESSKNNNFIEQLSEILPYCDDDGKLQVQAAIQNLQSEKQVNRESDFFYHFEEQYPNFFTNLKLKHPQLTPKELKVCVCILMNLSNKQMADFFSNAESTIKSARKGIRKKLMLDSNTDIVAYLKLLQ